MMGSVCGKFKLGGWVKVEGYSVFCFSRDLVRGVFVWLGSVWGIKEEFMSRLFVFVRSIKGV